MDHRLLIISNNVLSMTRSNGKVIMSYFDCLPKEMVGQLYFSSELPSIDGYRYFQLYDKDIIKGFFHPSKRGKSIVTVYEDNYKQYKPNPNTMKTSFFRLLREVLWRGKWKSHHLTKWLDEFNPTDIFFVGGDSLFAYDICEYVRSRFNSRLCVYITDDYIMPRTGETMLSKFRRKMIFRKLNCCLSYADQFFTISKPMQENYKTIFGKDSYLVTNMTEMLKDDSISANNEELIITYAGSLYYGRDTVLHELAKAIEKYNSQAKKKAKLKIYTNIEPSESEMDLISVRGASEYCGQLDRTQLICQMNKSDVLCIVESFEKKNMEKTIYSLSTKASEYMSVGKPILAVGPSGIGTIDYLSDAAYCITSENEIYNSLNQLFKSEELLSDYAQKALAKYKRYHEKSNVQGPFIEKVFGYNIFEEK